MLAFVRFLILWVGGSLAIVGVVLLPLVPGRWFGLVAAIAIAVSPTLVLAAAVSRGFYPGAAVRLFVFRPFWYLIPFAPLLAIAAVVGTLAGLPFGAPRTGGMWAITGIASVLAIASVFGYVGTRRLVVKRQDVSLPGFPDAFDGLRVVQISDLHVGPQTPRRHLSAIAKAVRQLEPDIIAITGDQVDDFPPDIKHFADAFGDLKAPLGVFAIAGNHDIYCGWKGVRDGLQAMGFRVLVNESVPLVRGSQRIWIAGTGDPAGAGWPRGGGTEAAPDVRATLAGIPSGETAIVLAHNPVLWRELAQRRRGPQLTLSGHTHYGQFAIPRLGWSIASAFIDPAMGTHRDGNAILYINPGTNYWGPPFRLGTPPEVTLHVLKATTTTAPNNRDQQASQLRVRS